MDRILVTGASGFIGGHVASALLNSGYKVRALLRPGSRAMARGDGLEAVIEDGDRAVVLDLEQLSYISSSGLRVMLLIARKLQRQQAKFALCSLSDWIREVLEISGFDRIIPVHASRSEAVSAVAG